MEREKQRANLLFYRHRSNLSQSQLATKGNIPIKALQAYESGQRDLNGAKLSTILKLCLALDCRIQDLLTDEETLTLLAEYE